MSPARAVHELFRGLGAEVPAALESVEPTGLSLDSRRVKPGDLFFALTGQKQDGSRFTGDALARGALAVVAEAPVPGRDTIVVSAPRKALASVAARFYGSPDREIGLIGITGTNGKTTTALLVGAIVEASGEKPGVIGTLGARVGSAFREGHFTTPEAPELCALLAEMVAAGVKHCAMEVSSHALAQDRVTGLSFAAAGFTHLTRDHLDFHGDLESYFAAKERLFTELLQPQAIAVINGDDPFGRRLAETLSKAGRVVYRFGRGPGSGAEIRIVSETLELSGTEIGLETPKGPLRIRSPLIGAHNAENLALAAGLGLAIDLPREVIERGLAGLAKVPGRLERVASGAASEPLAFVDYAHTDDALARVLLALRTLGARDQRRLFIVFGCGGDRDPGKRPLMGRAAAAGADVVVATSDNPRSEDPQAILAQVESGLIAGGKSKAGIGELKTGLNGYAVEPDRRKAIALTVDLARPNDVILVAGKGHETHQIIGAQKLPFDDRIELGNALSRRAP